MNALQTLKDSLPDSVSIEEIYNDESGARICFYWAMSESSGTYFSTGKFKNIESAIDFSTRVFNLGEREMAKLLQSTNLFPNINGAMIDKKDMVVTLSGKFKEIAPQEPNGKHRIELWFTDTPKTAILNRSQLLKLITLHGDDTEKWNGKRVSLYGEHGEAFGKKYCAVRVRDFVPPPAKADEPAEPTEPKARALFSNKYFIQAVIDGLGYETAELKQSMRDLGNKAIPGTPDRREELWNALEALKVIKDEEEE